MTVFKVTYGLKPLKGEYISNFAAINVLVGVDDDDGDDAEAAIAEAKKIAAHDIKDIRGKFEVKVEGVELLVKDVR